MLQHQNTIKAIGVMSGTSLDGVDIVACGFKRDAESRDYKIYSGITYPYPPEIYQRLKEAPGLSGYQLAKLNVDYGRFLGNEVARFINNSGFKPEFIASHGYTVFHEPQNGLTLQIGSGAEIAAITGIQTVSDFRTTDVALGGNGAPLVPVGDELLFGNYKACLNLGGFSNISYNLQGKRIAFDICPVNLVLNQLAQQLGKAYDANGEEGRKGNVNTKLLDLLNQLDFYRKTPPKSLGREFTDASIFPLFTIDQSVNNLLATFYEHIVNQISGVINQLEQGRVLITGGGAHNQYLIEKLRASCKPELIIPDAELVDMKEALIFAFLGLLRILQVPNCLKSVTGSQADNIGGAVYAGKG